MSLRNKPWRIALLLIVCFQATGLAQLPPTGPMVNSTEGQSLNLPPERVTAQNANQAWASDRVWSFNFQEAPWNVLLRDFSRSMGFSLTLGVDIPGTFTYYDDRKFTALEAIDILNDHLIPRGAILVRNEQRLVLVSTQFPINDNLVPFIPVSEIDSIGRNTVAGAAIPIKGIDPSTALSEVMAVKSSIGQVRAFSNTGRVLIIDTGTHLRRIRDLLLQTGFARSDTISGVYQLRHAKAEDVAKAINDFLSAQGAAGSGAGGGAMQFQPENDTDRVVAEKTTNCLLVRGSQESMPVIYRIICDLDRSPREVLLSALIVEVQLGNTKEFGVEIGIQDSVLFDRSIVNNIQTINQTSTSPNGVQTTNQTILSQSVSPGFAFNGAALGTNAASPGTIGRQGLTNFGAGRVNNELGFGGLVLSAGSESVSALLRALHAKFKVDVLSRPQVRTVENKEAFIQIGQQVPIVDGVTVNAVGSANPVVRQDKAGIILKATPRISPDGRVQIDVNTEKSAFLLTKGSGVPIFTDAVTGRVIEAPVKDITTASTTVSIQSGQTIVLGGMITNGENVVNRKVPFLGDIPLLGRLFRYDLNQFTRKELLVFLTPVVLHDELSNFHLEDELNNSKITPLTREFLDRWEQYRSVPEAFAPSPVPPYGIPPADGVIPNTESIPPSAIENLPPTNGYELPVPPQYSPNAQPSPAPAMQSPNLSNRNNSNNLGSGISPLNLGATSNPTIGTSPYSNPSPPPLPTPPAPPAGASLGFPLPSPSSSTPSIEPSSQPQLGAPGMLGSPRSANPNEWNLPTVLPAPVPPLNLQPGNINPQTSSAAQPATNNNFISQPANNSPSPITNPQAPTNSPNPQPLLLQFPGNTSTNRPSTDNTSISRGPSISMVSAPQDVRLTAAVSGLPAATQPITLPNPLAASANNSSARGPKLENGDEFFLKPLQPKPPTASSSTGTGAKQLPPPPTNTTKRNLQVPAPK